MSKKLNRNQKRKAKLAKREEKLKKYESRQTVSTEDSKALSLAEIMQWRMENMWNPEKIEEMETDAIFQKLRELGIEADEQAIRSHAPHFFSASDLAEHLWRNELNRIEGRDGDFPWMAAGVLWNRLCPEIANTDTIIDGIDAGSELFDQGNVAAACDRWLQVWNDLKSRFLEGIQSVDALDARAGDYYSIQGWLLSLDEELENVGLTHPDYLQKQTIFCKEVCELLPESPESFLKQLRSGIEE